MRIRIDEAGDFNYRDPGRSWISVLAGVVIPDSRWTAVERFVEGCREEWAVDELKAAELGDEQLKRVAGFMIDQDLTVAAIATDSSIFSFDAQRQWRERQVELMSAAIDRSKRARTDPQVAARVDRLRRRAANPRHVAAANYLQYAILAPWLLAHLLSAALLAYRCAPQDEDCWLFDVALDAKSGADPGKPGELLRDSLEAIFAGDDRTALRMPGEWLDDHPFKVGNTDPETGTITFRQVLRGGIHSADSDSDAGLQLADLVAHLVLSVLRDTSDAGAAVAWQVLLPKVMPTEDGWPIKVWAWPADGVHADQERYHRLLPC